MLSLEKQETLNTASSDNTECALRKLHHNAAKWSSFNILSLYGFRGNVYHNNRSVAIVCHWTSGSVAEN
jgi:hypothetical protein